MNRTEFNFEKLIVYQKALDYIDLVYKLTAKFSKSEAFGLSSQFRNAANSIALNIGEGSVGTEPEFRNFIRFSFRSLHECVVCSTISIRQNYISEDENSKSRNSLQEMTRMLSGLRNALNKKK